MNEPVADCVYEPVAEMESDSVADLVNDFVKEPVADLVNERVAELVYDSVADCVWHPIIFWPETGQLNTAAWFDKVPSSGEPRTMLRPPSLMSSPCANPMVRIIKKYIF